MKKIILTLSALLLMSCKITFAEAEGLIIIQNFSGKPVKVNVEQQIAAKVAKESDEIRQKNNKTGFYPEDYVKEGEKSFLTIYDKHQWAIPTYKRNEGKRRVSWKTGNSEIVYATPQYKHPDVVVITGEKTYKIREVSGLKIGKMSEELTANPQVIIHGTVAKKPSQQSTGKATPKTQATEKKFLTDANGKQIEIKFGETKCPVCMDEFTDKSKKFVQLSCGHIVCQDCIDKWFDTKVASRALLDFSKPIKHNECPLCRKVTREAYIKEYKKK